MTVLCFCYCDNVLLIVLCDSVYIAISNSCVYQFLKRKPPYCISYNTISSSKKSSEVSEYYVCIKTIHLPTYFSCIPLMAFLEIYFQNLVKGTMLSSIVCV